ncbi:ATP-binding protein [Cryptosporangium aurantiacum]|uniref:Sensor-like histidine kinase SenX3 n=1 Tax=Cryptosporangium aurantiacum TaxID=134849 RepID=A0A1M7PSQ5_9ACTN|nr:ATP-binding protein [Cryptosporangium aurantiacum]SHN20475.1 Signal transduction histidine kinase [Cryptosporangium aurantiacum]
MREHRKDGLERGIRSVAALTVLVVLVGSLASLGVGSVLRDSAQRSAVRVLDVRTAVLAATVRTEVNRYIDQMRTLAAAFGAMDTLTAADFARATAALGPISLPGATSIAYLVPVAHDRVAAVQAAWRARGSTGLVIRPYGTGTHAVVVLSTRLDAKGTLGHGVDVNQAPAPRAAVREALRNDAVTVSDTYQLIIDRQLPPEVRQNSFALTAPVHGFDAAGNRQFRGWIMMGLRGQDFIRTTLSRVALRMIDVSLSARNADGRETEVAGLVADSTDRRDQFRTVEMPVAQRRWVLRTAAVSADLPGGNQMLSTALTAALLGFTALLAALVGTLAGARRRAERRVRVATTELRATEREARDQARLLGTVLDTITEGVGVVDSNGQFLAHNPAAKRMLGINDDISDPDQWQQHYGLFRPDGSEFPTEELPLMRALAGEAPDEVEMLVRNRARPEGALITVSARQLQLADGSIGAVAVFHDVTQARAYEAELQAFAGVVAHDLKSPLTTVVGYGELLSDILTEEASAPVREEGLGHLERIQATAERMRTLIDDLLSYSSARDATLHRASFPLGDVVHEVVAARLEASRARGHFPDIYVGPLPFVEGDPVLIRQVLDNLVGNALKYTPPGRPARVDITARSEAGVWVRVEVADRGIGIPHGEHGRVFARFHRAHTGESYPGTGLGLAICQRIVERHGGTIGADDNPGGGTRFWFTLPYGEEPADTPQAALIPERASSGRSSSA